MKVTRYLIVAALFIAISMGLVSCSQGEKSHMETVKVAAAGNLTFILKPLKKNFTEIYPRAAVQFITASSGKLTMQIQNGADFDIFLSADMGYPEKLYSDGFSLRPPKEYSRGELILFSREGFRRGEGIEMLSRNRIKRIAIANGKLAPYGRAAYEVIKNSGIKNVRPKLVEAANIMQTAQYALLGAGAGFISRSALQGPALKKWNIEGRYWIAVDSKLYRPIRQGILLLKRGEQKKHAVEFYKYMFSPEVKKLMTEYGYRQQDRE